ncbi:NUDIX hydrolase [Patescibacteria group bacterium]|nr:NUDIX hydrolase [Patescibacteria group bacterium]
MKKYTYQQNKKYYNSLDKKRISVGTLFFDSQDKLLLVKPTYKDHWVLVGGTVDKNESPLTAAIRETKEELDLTVKNLRLISVEYKKFDIYKNEALFFLFYGGRLSTKQINKIKLPYSELLDFKFVNINSAKKLLSLTMGSKLNACSKAIKNKTIAYHENGKQLI